MADHYDLVIIGAGIQGAGMAQAAAAAGYSTLILEKTAIAAGTSSNSSKLIHGGLRYLETGQLSLVRECLNERNLLLKVAPDLIHLTPFNIPIYTNTSRSALTLRCGLTLYSALSGFNKSSLFKTLNKKQWSRLDGLNTQNLNTVFQYYDAQTDDKLLTEAVIKSALNLNAKIKVPAIFKKANHYDDYVDVCYSHHSKNENCTAKVLVNCTGPWVENFYSNITPSIQKPAIELIQGTHIILPLTIEQGIYYLESPIDQRAIFVMPWYGQCLVGTTEIPFSFHHSADKIKASNNEIEYLLTTFNSYFKHHNFTADKITGIMCGLRVLPKQNVSPFSRKRNCLISQHIEQPRIISILGGKLTSYRATAARAISLIKPLLPERKVLAKTQNIVLSP